MKLFINAKKFPRKTDKNQIFTTYLHTLEKLEINATLTPKQFEALEYLMDKTTTEIGFWGWAGWGKSRLWVVRVWTMCQNYADVRYFLARRELKRLKETTLNTYFKFCASVALPKIYTGKLNNQAGSIKFNNGSEILLLDVAYQPSDPLYERLGSLEFTGWFIDEAGEVDRMAIQILSTRVGRQNNEKYGICPKILETFNPNKWHIYERYYLAKKKGIMPAYRKFIVSLATDNSKLDKNYIEQLEKADVVTKQRLLYGNFEYDDDPLKIYDINEIYDAFTNPSTKKAEPTKYLVCDVARFGNDSIRIWYREDDDLIEIITRRKQGIDETIEDIKKLEAERWVRRSNIVIDSDWVWGWVADGLRGCINFINNATPYQEYDDKFMKNNFANLKTQCAFKLKEKMQKGKIRLNMNAEDKELFVQEAENIRVKNPDTWGKTKLEEKEELKRILWRSPDIFDMVMMKQVFDVRKIISDNAYKTPVITISRDEELY